MGEVEVKRDTDTMGGGLVSQGCWLLLDPPHILAPSSLTVGSRPMWCTDMDTFCTMWKRSPATVMVLPPLQE
jgi:hypothetical protein